MIKDLDQFIETFWGYGNWQSPIWFVGMEEGGCEKLDDYKKRLLTWASLGGKDLVGCKDYHEKLAEYYDVGSPTKTTLNRLFNNRVKLQPTWNKIIRFYLSASAPSEYPITREIVRTFQRDCLHMLCLIELLPLPVKSIRPEDWFYNDPECIDEIPFLRTRPLYTEKLLKKRIESLIAKAKESKPRLIVAYGKRYQAEWEYYLGKLQEIQCGIPNSLTAQIGDSTKFVLLPHPRGVPQSHPWQIAGIYFRQASL